jgi:hypothetical protein
MKTSWKKLLLKFSNNDKLLSCTLSEKELKLGDIYENNT